MMRRTHWLPTVSLIVEWRDFWVGAFVDTAKCRLYLLPVPCLGVVLQWPVPKVQRSPRPVVRRTIIVAGTYAQAREHARRELKQGTDWRYVSRVEDLNGLRHVDLVKLHGWELNGWDFVRGVRRLEQLEEMDNLLA